MFLFPPLLLPLFPTGQLVLGFALGWMLHGRADLGATPSREAARR